MITPEMAYNLILIGIIIVIYAACLISEWRINKGNQSKRINKDK